MKSSEYMIALATINNKFAELKLPVDFVPQQGDTNQENSMKFDMHTAMAEQVVAAQLKSLAEKRLEASKKRIDACATAIGKQIDVLNDSAIEIYHDDDYSYTKKRGKEQSSVDAKKLVIVLHQLGIDLDTLAKAIAAATETRKGNQYYVIEHLRD